MTNHTAEISSGELMDPLRQPKTQETVCKARPTNRIYAKGQMNIHGSEKMICILYEMLKSDQTITRQLFRTQLIRLKQALAENATR